jgi:hypothetical protein
MVGMVFLFKRTLISTRWIVVRKICLTNDRHSKQFRVKLEPFVNFTKVASRTFEREYNVGIVNEIEIELAELEQFNLHRITN